MTDAAFAAGFAAASLAIGVLYGGPSLRFAGLLEPRREAIRAFISAGMPG